MPASATAGIACWTVIAVSVSQSGLLRRVACLRGPPGRQWGSVREAGARRRRPLVGAVQREAGLGVALVDLAAKVQTLLSITFALICGVERLLRHRCVAPARGTAAVYPSLEQVVCALPAREAQPAAVQNDKQVCSICFEWRVCYSGARLRIYLMLSNCHMEAPLFSTRGTGTRPAGRARRDVRACCCSPPV